MSQPRLLLETLNSQKEWTAGLELLQAQPRIARWSLYVYLAELEDAGFVRFRYRGSTRQREYEITSRGRAALLRDDL